jgi:hypothetical protein
MSAKSFVLASLLLLPAIPAVLVLAAGLTNGTPQLALKSWRGMEYDVQSSTDLANWSLLETLSITKTNGLTQIVDTNETAEERFYRVVSR